MTTGNRESQSTRRKHGVGVNVRVLMSATSVASSTYSADVVISNPGSAIVRLDRPVSLPLKSASANCRVGSYQKSFIKAIPSTFSFEPGKQVDDIELELLNAARFAVHIDPLQEFTIPVLGFHKCAMTPTFDQVSIPDPSGHDMAIEMHNVKLEGSAKHVANQMHGERRNRVLKAITRTSLPYAARKLADILHWYVKVAQEYGIEHNDLHPDNIVWDKATRQLRIIDMGRTLMTGTFSDEDALRDICGVTGRSFDYSDLVARIQKRLHIPLPRARAPWLNDVMRVTMEIFLDASEGAVPFGWGCKILQLPSGSRAVVRDTAQLTDAETVVDRIEASLGNMPGPAYAQDLMALASIGFGMFCVFALRAQESYSDAPDGEDQEDDEPACLEIVRRLRFNKLPESMFLDFIWSRPADLFEEEDVNACERLTHTVLDFVTSSQTGGSGADGENGDDSVLCEAFPTSLEQAYAQKDERTLQDAARVRVDAAALAEVPVDVDEVDTNRTNVPNMRTGHALTDMPRAFAEPMHARPLAVAGGGRTGIAPNRKKKSGSAAVVSAGCIAVCVVLSLFG